MPLFAAFSGALYDAVDGGASYADGLLSYSEDPWFWSHSARYAIRKQLSQDIGNIPSWDLVERVPNSGVHLAIAGVHRVRLVRSLNRDVPNPGRNTARQLAWTNHDLGLSVGPDSLPLLNLLVDWHMHDEEPLVHVSCPKGPWHYGAATRVHWREPLPRGAASFANISFSGDDGGDPLTATLYIDESEAGSA